MLWFFSRSVREFQPWYSKRTWKESIKLNLEKIGDRKTLTDIRPTGLNIGVSAFIVFISLSVNFERWISRLSPSICPLDFLNEVWMSIIFICNWLNTYRIRRRRVSSNSCLDPWNKLFALLLHVMNSLFEADCLFFLSMCLINRILK